MVEGSLENAPNGLRYINHLGMRSHHLATIVEAVALEASITLKCLFQCMEILNTCGINTLVHFVMHLTIVWLYVSNI